jgi:hypothetical protein
LKLSIYRGDCRTSREEAQEAQNPEKRAFFLRLLCFFVAIQGVLELALQFPICNLACSFETRQTASLRYGAARRAATKTGKQQIEHPPPLCFCAASPAPVRFGVTSEDEDEHDRICYGMCIQ